MCANNVFKRYVRYEINNESRTEMVSRMCRSGKVCIKQRRVGTRAWEELIENNNNKNQKKKKGPSRDLKIEINYSLLCTGNVRTRAYYDNANDRFRSNYTLLCSWRLRYYFMGVRWTG